MPIIPLKQVNKQNPLYRFYDEVINRRKLKVLNELFSDNYVNHIIPFGLEKTANGTKRHIEEQTKAFPDWHITIDYWIQDGNKHIVKWTLEGTHTGKFYNIEPTGKKFKKSGIDIETVIDNKLVEHDGADDMLSLLKQIDALDNYLISN